MLNRFIALGAAALAGAYLVKKFNGRNAGGNAEPAVRESIVVNVPVRTAYNQWTQFEAFPAFMQSVHEVKQLDDKRLHWKADVMGKTIEWDAEITEQIPDQRIAWRSTSGKQNDGVVMFEALSAGRTRITLQMAYTPEGPAEELADTLGVVRGETCSNLKRFKEMMEQRGKETGAWRGTIKDQGPGLHPAS